MRASPRSLARFLALALVATACKDSNGPEKPGAPVDIRVSAGDNQKGAAGAALVAPIAAKVTDAKGHGVPGVEVTFTPEAGTVAPVQVQTNGSGVAFTTWTMPTVAGTYSVRASFIDAATGALIDTVSFHAKVIGGTPAAMYPLSDF
ncbi:MAG: Ig-like domain-containing protein, partial [Gemmatimonadaceae bacterium]|nr:Ig-like domain-containing protein [Gemmatimonadaceae bacterium]